MGASDSQLSSALQMQRLWRAAAAEAPALRGRLVGRVGSGGKHGIETMFFLGKMMGFSRETVGFSRENHGDVMGNYGEVMAK